MRWHYLPNLITILRIILIVPVCYNIVQDRFLPALYFLILAGLSDGLDGYLARRFNWQTRLGSLLDPLADKLMVISCFTALTWVQAIPLWLFIIILLKDIIVVTGAIIYHFFIASYEFSATLLSKLNTFLQILFLVTVVIKMQFASIPNILILALMYVMLLTTLGCTLDYIWIWSKKAYTHVRKSHD
ncbi:MAG: CDP-alcohol phosphatidyltransferase [Gammaproteobacteria bacterium]|jgi:cardiolipin synthase|nr:CDP-alcohol phosphatidyltransferase [Gammaproteobacteria bacterium]